MSLPFSINKNDAVLVFMNKCKQIAIYSRNSHSVVAAFSLKNSVSGNTCSVCLWVNGQTLYVDRGPLPAATIDSINVNLNNDEGTVWLDTNQLIIGTGDMRDGMAYTVQYDLSAVGDRGLAIQHENDNRFNIYSTVNRATRQITSSLYTCQQ